MIIDVVIDEGVSGIGLVDHRRPWFERVLYVEHDRQGLVVDPHLRDRLKCFALAVGDYGDDRLALVADLVHRERRLVVLAEIDQAEERVEVARDVRAADDPAYTG